MERRNGRGNWLPEDPGWDRRASARFAIALAVRYAVRHRRRVVDTGSGRTIDISSTGLCFTADGPLRTGMALDVSVDWPVPLDGGVHLQLIVSGLVVRTSGTQTALRIERHEFKTRSWAEGRQVPHL
jgi:hypothetical protein